MFTFKFRRLESPRPRAGFALLITIILMAFLVLLMVSMASLTRVETQIASNSQKADQARANALMALNVALGELQRHVGPDQRTTARADILSTTRSTTDTFTSPNVTGLGGTVYQNNNLLTGAWSNSADCRATGTPSTDNSAYVNTPALLTWLVSGNQTATYTIDADASTSNQSADKFVSNFGRVIKTGSSPSTPIYSATSKLPVDSTDNLAVQMVGPGTVGGGTSPTTAQQALMVAAITQPIQVRASQIPGLGSSSTLTTVGRYAYWVGDEGVKAKYNIADAWGTAASGSAQSRYRYQVAQRAGIEQLYRTDQNGVPTATAIGATVYDQNSAAGRNDIAKAISYNSVVLSLLAAGDSTLTTAAQPTVQTHFHDLTTYSQGVLSDTLHGGLKKDLTAAFVTGSLPSSLTSTTNNKNKLWYIPSAALGASYGANMVAAATTNTYDGLGPDWQVLRSFAQIPNIATNKSGTGTSFSMDPIAPIALTNPTEQTQMGVNPVIVGFQLATQCKLVQNGANSYLEVKHMPAIMLWNPYNVTLNATTLDCEMDYRTNRGEYIPATYYARIVQVPTANIGASPLPIQTNSNVSTASGTAAYTAPGPPPAVLDVISPLFNNTAKIAASGASVNPLKVKVNTGSMPPGMAYIYTMDATSEAACTVTAPNLAPGATATLATLPIPTLSRGWNTPGAVPSVPYGICFQSAKFTVPTATAGNTILFNAFSGGGNSTHPTTGAFLAPAGSISDAQMTLLAKNGANPIQLVLGDGLHAGFQYYFTMAQANTRTGVNFHRSLLKANTSASTFAGKVPWLASYNPRSTNSYPTAWEYQKANAGQYTLTGYDSSNGSLHSNSNPSFYKEFDMSLGATISAAYALGKVTPLTSSLAAANYTTGVYTIDQTNGPVVLFDVPRPSQPILSIATLQHADTYRATFDTTGQYPLRFANNAGPAYVIGNSKADQRVGVSSSLPYGFYKIASTSSQGNYITNVNDDSVPPVYYDHSYLANRALWDGYFFSTAPSPVVFPLPNGRHVIPGEALSTDSTTLLDYNKAATRLVVDGAFNINSTSVEAWTAVLASTVNAPVGAQAQANQAPVPRLGYPYSDTAIANGATEASTNPNTYNGYRALTAGEISTLATEIVKQVKARGPFVSLADFVNRALVDNGTAKINGTTTQGTLNDLRLGGALHAAIANTSVNSAYTTTLLAPDASFTTAALYPIVKDLGNTVGGNAAGDGTSPAQATPGWVTQADLLQVLGPVISARSDTFVIRVYGEVVDPINSGTVQSKAWAEAVVQRTPQYIDQTDTNITADGDATPPTAFISTSDNFKFGRRFKVISFRWLSPSEI